VRIGLVVIVEVVVVVVVFQQRWLLPILCVKDSNKNKMNADVNTKRNNHIIN
jgi:hypothetical protein